MLALLPTQQQRPGQLQAKEKELEMAAAKSAAWESEPQEPLTVESLQEAISCALLEAENNFSKKLEHLFSPIKVQLAEIQASLTKTSQIAETALDMGVTLQEDTLAHQQDISDLKEKYLVLAAAQKENNLKFRGLEENCEGSSDLISFMCNWLAIELNLEPKIFPSITKAYRMGVKKPGRTLSRDINVSFADFRVKKRIQNLARENNGLNFNGRKIAVFPDLPPEALSIRRELKPILQKLQEARIRYQWSSLGS